LSIVWWCKIDGEKKELQIWKESIAAVLVDCLDPLLFVPDCSVLICWSQIQNINYIKLTTSVLQNPTESAFTMGDNQPAKSGDCPEIHSYVCRLTLNKAMMKWHQKLRLSWFRPYLYISIFLMWKIFFFYKMLEWVSGEAEGFASNVIFQFNQKLKLFNVEWITEN